MSVRFENMLASIDGQDYYAESIDISESISIQEFSALGTKNASAFPTNRPEGTININFYITSGVEISNIEDQYAETGFVQVQAGPFTLRNAILNSFSIQGDATSLIKGSASYNYYGQMESGSTPSKGTAEIVPAHGASSYGALTNFGAHELLDFDYSFNQSMEVQYVLGNNDPAKVIFNDATQEFNLSNLISDMNFTKTNLTGVDGLCDGSASGEGFYERSGSLYIKNLCNESVYNLTVSGFIQERSLSSQPGGEVIESIKITKKFVANKGCDE
jgi:hypothetical protein|tara:strand:- start:13470 stop:14291 length:822 start_codon:yes stop_codon:yes gene_type:complete